MARASHTVKEARGEADVRRPAETLTPGAVAHFSSSRRAPLDLTFSGPTWRQDHTRVRPSASIGSAGGATSPRGNHPTPLK
jgi:hypothetical protein